MMGADAFRNRLAELGLSQNGAGRALDIAPRTIRRYVAGELKVPRVVELALSALGQMDRSQFGDRRRKAAR